MGPGGCVRCEYPAGQGTAHGRLDGKRNDHLGGAERHIVRVLMAEYRGLLQSLAGYRPSRRRSLEGNTPRQRRGSRRSFGALQPRGGLDGNGDARLGGRLSAATLTNTGSRFDPEWNPAAPASAWNPVNPTGAPTAREDFVSAWDGTRMIVWGGYNGTTYLDTGAMYSPAAYSWTATTVSLPARARAAFAFTGEELFIWGGYNGAYLSSGSRFFPSGNSWSALPSSGLTIREKAAAVWTGEKFMVWGGFGSGTFKKDGPSLISEPLPGA